MPHTLAGLEIDRDETVRKQVVAVAMPAVVVIRRHLGRQIRQTKLFVDADLTPDAGVPRIPPRVVEPRVVPNSSPRGIVWKIHRLAPVRASNPRT